MGFKEFTKTTITYQMPSSPSFVIQSEIKYNSNPYTGQCWSYEQATNSPPENVGFQQRDKTVVDYMFGAAKYPSGLVAGSGWDRMYETANVMATMWNGTIYNQKKVVDADKGTFVDILDDDGNPIPMPQTAPSIDPFTSTGHFDWETACKYYLIAMAFGMVDSLGKNLTLRSWNAANRNQGLWYTSFYDMDTALGINNAGLQEIKSNVDVDYWYNEVDEISGATDAKRLKNDYPDNSEGISKYEMYCSRLW